MSLHPEQPDLDDEYDRAVGDLGCRGIKLSLSYQVVDPVGEAAFHLFARLEEDGLPAVFHQGASIASDARLTYAHPLAMDQVAIAFPRLKIVLAHVAHPWYEDCVTVVRKHPNVWTEVSGFGVGDRVFVAASHGQYAAVPAHSAIRLPDAISDEVAVFLSILEVGHIGLRTGNPEPGENVAIMGGGVIGLSALAYCRAFGFRTAVIELDRGRLDLAGKMGADLLASPEEEGFSDSVLEFFGGEGADLVLEAASVWPAIETGMQIARKGGRVVVIARHTDMPAFSPVSHPYLGKGLALFTSYGHQADGHRWDRRRSNSLTLELLSKGKLLVSPMITDRFDWQELPDIYRRMDEGDKGLVGVVIHWS